MTSLQELIRYKVAYYSGKPLISDSDYDALEEVFRQTNPDVEIPVDMGNQLRGVFNQPYISLKKLNTEQLGVWCKGDLSSLVATPKIDGVSMEVCLVPGDDGAPEVLYARTRGGVDRTDAFLRSLDEMCFFGCNSIEQPMILRGECFLPNSLEEKIKELGYKNPRNLTSGLINSDDGNEFNGKMRFEIWDWLNSPYETYKETLKALHKLGFPVVHPVEITTLDRLKSLEDDFDAYTFKRDFDYEIDGLVFWKNDRTTWGNDDGRSTYTHAMAWKFPAQYAESTIVDVVWTTGNSGYITPVAKVEPVEIGGVTVTSINLHNPRNLTELNVEIGSIAKIRRAGDVIPHIAEPCVATPESREVPIPNHCPTCGKTAVTDGPRLKCGSDQCEAVFAGILHVWAELHKWKYFSDEAIGHLTPYFKLHSNTHPVLKIYDIDFEVLSTYMTPGKAKRLWDQLQEAKKTTTEASLLVSLNLPSVGLKVASGMLANAGLLENIPTIYRDREKVYVAENVVLEWIDRNPEFWSQLLELSKSLGVNKVVTTTTEVPKQTKGKVVITGSLPGLTRKEAFELINLMGYEASETLNKTTTILICDKPDSTSSKTKKAKELNIPVMKWETFFEENH